RCQFHWCGHLIRHRPVCSNGSGTVGRIRMEGICRRQQPRQVLSSRHVCLLLRCHFAGRESEWLKPVSNCGNTREASKSRSRHGDSRSCASTCTWRDNCLLPHSPFAVKSFATLQNAKGLPQPPTAVRERIRSCRVEFKHFVVARNHQLRTDIVRQFCGFLSRKIARHTPFWSAPIDGKKRHVDCERAQLLCHPVVAQCVTTVVEAPSAES